MDWEEPMDWQEERPTSLEEAPVASATELRAGAAAAASTRRRARAAEGEWEAVSDPYSCFLCRDGDEISREYVTRTSAVTEG
jgi:hypothetical protein